MTTNMPKEDSTDQKQGSNQATLSGTSTSRSTESSRSVDTNASRTDADGCASASSGLRHRSSTTRQKHQQNQHQPYSTCRDLNGMPIFTLAGPNFQDGQNGERSNHQAFVETGYTELNPAYDQPGDIRPIWGLAGPLPRTVRPGTKPSDQEIKSGKPKEDVLQPTESQMEQGYGLKKMIKDIHDATTDRRESIPRNMVKTNATRILAKSTMRRRMKRSMTKTSKLHRIKERRIMHH